MKIKHTRLDVRVLGVAHHAGRVLRCAGDPKPSHPPSHTRTHTHTHVQYGNTALMIVAQKTKSQKRQELLKLLVECKANTKLKDNVNRDV